MAKMLTEESFAKTVCGSPNYVAPEILSGSPYGKECDYWSFGVILYVMLAGEYPFKHDNFTVLFEKIKNADFHFENEVWSEISDQAKDFI
jgi:serine/threonine-protein kinase Chk2